MILSSSEHCWFKNHDFSARVQNCIVYLIQAVQKLQIHVFFAEKPCSECCKNTPHIDHQSIIARRYNVKNRAQNAANFFRKITILSIVSTMNTGRFVKRVVHFYDFDRSGRCSFLMILSSSEHFWFKNHDFSARAPNCLVYVIVAVQNMKIHVFRKVPRIYRFLVNILRFL